MIPWTFSSALWGMCWGHLGWEELVLRARGGREGINSAFPSHAHVHLRGLLKPDVPMLGTCSLAPALPLVQVPGQEGLLTASTQLRLISSLASLLEGHGLGPIS